MIKVSFATNNIPDDQLADYYDAAADYLETHEWARGLTYNPRTTGVCASGALCAVISPEMFSAYVHRQTFDSVSPEYMLWMEAARRAIATSSVSYWNDNEAKDKYEVIDMFRNRAKELRNG